MKNYTEIKVKQNKLNSVVCDKCGIEYSNNTIEGQTEIQEFLFIKFTGGYGSIFEDMSKVRCDLCQHCVKELLGKYLTIIDSDIFGGI